MTLNDGTAKCHTGDCTEGRHRCTTLSVDHQTRAHNIVSRIVATFGLAKQGQGRCQIAFSRLALAVNIVGTCRG